MLIRYFGAAKAAAGAEEERLAAGSLEAPTLHALLEHLAARPAAETGTAPEGAPGLKSVISRSTFLVNEFAARDRSVQLTDADTVDILPPFAGG